LQIAMASCEADRRLARRAATNEAEDFAVATEAFFERPGELAVELPELYAALRDFYRLELARPS
jgi:Mlc titration factor MtfA (ptsG expression regulator)